MLTGLGGVRLSSLMNADNVVFRGRVRAVAVANVTIATLNNGDSLDGLTLATGDLVLLTGQTTASENGVYDVAATEGNTARWAGFNDVDEVTIGSVFLCGEGTVYAESLWMMVTGGDITLDTTDLNFFRLEELRAIAGVPTEAADGGRVRPWPDTFGRRVPKGFDLGQDAQQVTDVAPALVLAPITVWPALTDPGTTAWVSAANFHHSTFVYVVASIDDTVVVRAEGSPDEGSNVYNMDDDEADVTKVANGVFILHKPNFKAGWVRFRFVSETGGTAASVTPFLIQGN